MKTVKKLLLSVVTLVLLVGCNSANKGDLIEIGIIQIVEHASLDESRQGFIDELAKLGYEDGVNIKIDYKNAQGDINTLNTIANSFVSENKDLIFAIATPSAQAIANSTKTIPTVFTAVTDPVEAKLVNTLESPKGNITGTTDAIDIEKQFNLLLELDPSVKKIGIVYNTSEVNAQVQVDQAKEIAKKLNLEIVTKGITSSNDLAVATKSLVSEIDALYLLTDNMVTAALPVVLPIANEANIPTLGSVIDHVNSGALAVDGIDYYALGQQTAHMAKDIIEGSEPNTMPVQKLVDTEIVINKKTAELLKITIPEALLNCAKLID